MTNAKKNSHRQGYRTGEFVVYPAHGVGQIVAIEEQEVAGFKLELFVISFEKDKMTLRVPTAKAATVGMRKLAENALVSKALETITGRARVKRTMWSRRAQEYEAKINSGDLIAIAEVVRDLHRAKRSSSSKCSSPSRPSAPRLPRPRPRRTWRPTTRTSRKRRPEPFAGFRAPSLRRPGTSGPFSRSGPAADALTCGSLPL